MQTAAWVFFLLGSFCSAPLWAADELPPRLVAKALPAGYVIVPGSGSPDGRYAVSAYDNTVNPMPVNWEYAPNKVIDLRAGEVVGNIRAKDAAMHMGHGEILPSRWSADGSLLLWEVSGKWCPRALTLLRLREGRITWQTNLLLETQRAVLERSRRADPKGYRAAMQENRGKGKDNRLGSGTSVYPDGFTVDVSTDAVVGRSLNLPLKVTASLTANPKGLEPYPVEANLNALLAATVEEGGRLQVTFFQMAKRPFPPFARAQASDPVLPQTALASRRRAWLSLKANSPAP